MNLDHMLEAVGLTVLGHFAPDTEDALPSGTECVALVGPSGPHFWEVFTASPEYADGRGDPLDRWSERVLDQVATEFGATALYPFGGPPWHPFIDWALRTGQIFTSPIGLLVHETHGLFVSFRGALALPFTLDAAQAISPCDTCGDQPCRKACPVDALRPQGYDVPRCKAHLDTPEGSDCWNGCLARRACPVGSALRPAEQSAFHMRAFHTVGRA